MDAPDPRSSTTDPEDTMDRNLPAICTICREPATHVLAHPTDARIRPRYYCRRDGQDLLASISEYGYRLSRLSAAELRLLAARGPVCPRCNAPRPTWPGSLCDVCNHDTSPRHVVCALPSPRNVSGSTLECGAPVRARLVPADSEPEHDVWAVDLTFRVVVQRMNERPGAACRGAGDETPDVALDEIWAHLRNDSVTIFDFESEEEGEGENDLDGGVGTAIVLPGGKLAIKLGTADQFAWCGTDDGSAAEFTHQALAAINEVLPPTTSAKGGDA